MKTHLIQLERHDDVISTRDKMTWGQAARILLVWPRRGRILRRRVDLVLLQRQATALGAQLALVTHDAEVIDQAGEVGILVFPSASQAQRSAWRRPKSARRPRLRLGDPIPAEELRQQMNAVGVPHRENLWVRLLAFLVGVLAVLALVVFFLPSARVRFTPNRREQSIRLPVWADLDLQALNVTGGVPASVARVVVEGRDTLASSGATRVPDRPAEGAVRLFNLTDQPVGVPAGLVVTTLAQPPQRFATLSEVTVPAGAGKSMDVLVRALAPGSTGNVEKGQVRSIEGPVGARLTVDNPAALSGGSDLSSPAPSEADAEALRQRLMRSLRQTATLELSGRLLSEQVLLPETVQVREVLEEERDPEAGQAAARLTLRLRAEFSAWVVDQRDLRALAKAALDANLPQGYQEVASSLNIASDGEVESTASGSMRWTLSATRRIEPAWNREDLIRQMVGRDPQEAAALVQRALDLEKAPEMNIWPGGWRRMPFLPAQIEVSE